MKQKYARKKKKRKEACTRKQPNAKEILIRWDWDIVLLSETKLISEYLKREQTNAM